MNLANRPGKTVAMSGHAKAIRRAVGVGRRERGGAMLFSHRESGISSRDGRSENRRPDYGSEGPVDGGTVLKKR